jgi:hypothetical protein
MIDTYYDFRDRIVDALCKDLLGPIEEYETLEDLPGTQYAVGVLFPREGNTFPAERNHQQEFGSDEGEDPPVALANVKFPSSMGITFAVDTQVTDSIEIDAEAARYRIMDHDQNGQMSPPEIVSKRIWRREPLRLAEPITVDLQPPVSRRVETTIDGLTLFVRIRPRDARGISAVTVVLINTLPGGRKAEERDANSFFQVRLKVQAPQFSAAPFVERPSNASTGEDADLKVYALLYRHAREFAAGHGCAATWEVLEDDPTRAVSIATEFIPAYRLPLADSNPAFDSSGLSMLRLSTESRSEVCNALETICTSYDAWIRDREDELASDPQLKDFASVAGENLALCQEASGRIAKGIELIRRSDSAWRAFSLMNKAMLVQRARSEWIKKGKETIAPEENHSHAWRPFQIAFILMCITGIAEPGAPDNGRDYADLLWFPTGGGKTEAYLGLIAFTVFHRRLTSDHGGGVTALMRYTLRLLTIQQFERATLLICACELLRREHPSQLGSDPISIGLWLGKDSTPNSMAEARTALNKLRAGSLVEKSNPVQLHTCPWCAHGLTHTNYWIKQDKSRLVVNCKQADCAFKDGLPVFVVDEDVYRHRPTLIIATADKFASIPWLDKCAALFNRTAQGLGNQLPPELIIQDELHLISGPLGSLAGLYETAIDVLATRDGIKPKVIASTATIRRASDQTLALFARPMRQFPPPALDARDSYFAVEADPKDKGDRMYVGLMAPSTSHTTLLVRTYAALLQAPSELAGSDDVKDQYWTIVGYFNSLRVLGGARMQVQDDVEDRLTLLAAQHGKPKREIKSIIELTSRRTSSEIPENLKQMGVPYPAAVDVILATNMISVGVDVDRLGVMAVMGQPQSTSEYIQSTSRVGRRYPGLVVTMYNSARSRDRSHYESFRAYHSALYRQVESTSVTPFSARARDRALHAVVVTLARMMIPALAANDAASRVSSQSDRLVAIKRLIEERVRIVDEEEADATAVQLDQIVQTWIRRAEKGELVYMDLGDPTKALLTDPLGGGIDDDMFGTLWSLRDVDQDSKLYFVSERAAG